MAKNIFSEIAGSKSTVRSSTIVEGKGLMVINTLKLEEMNDGLTFVAEMKVVESSSNGSDPQGNPTRPNPVGQTVAYIQKLVKHKQTALGNVKGFMCAVLDMTEDDAANDPDAFESDCSALVTDSQPGRGVLVRYETYRQPTKAQKAAGRGEYNVYCRFFPVPDQDDAAVAARRAALEGGAAAAQ